MTQGIQWKDGILPERLYMFAASPWKKAAQLTVDDYPSIEWSPLEDADEGIKSLMRWIHDAYVLHFADNTVCCYEQVVFFVSDAKFEGIPGYKWCAQVDVFDVLEQHEAVFLFRLAA